MAVMKRWMWAGAALWLAIVGIGAGLAWIAIDGAGRQVTASEPLTPDRTSAASTPTTGLPSATPTEPASGPTPTTATSQPAPTDRPRFRTWTGAAGSVTVSCTGLRAQLKGATPADGWRVERTESGAEVRVRFERNEVETRVEARCSPSGPVFEVRTGAEDENEDRD